MVPSTLFYNILIKSVTLRKIFVQQIKLECYSVNLIYLISCSKCHSDYKKLHERINGHKTGFKNPTKHGYCQILCNHFTCGMCKGATYQFQIKEKLPDNGRKNMGSKDPSWTQIRKFKKMSGLKNYKQLFHMVKTIK